MEEEKEADEAFFQLLPAPISKAIIHLVLLLKGRKRENLFLQSEQDK